MTSSDPTGSAAPVVLGGRYEVHRRLARGGMAEVFLARDQALDVRDPVARVEALVHPLHLVGKAVVGLGQRTQFVVGDGRQVAREVPLSATDLVEDRCDHADRAQDQEANVEYLQDVPSKRHDGQADQ